MSSSNFRDQLMEALSNTDELPCLSESKKPKGATVFGKVPPDVQALFLLLDKLHSEAQAEVDILHAGNEEEDPEHLKCMEIGLRMNRQQQLVHNLLFEILREKFGLTTDQNVVVLEKWEITAFKQQGLSPEDMFFRQLLKNIEVPEEMFDQ